MAAKSVLSRTASPGPSTGTRKPAGQTPTIVYSVPAIFSARPRTPGSPPSRSIQRRWLITATRGRSASSSPRRSGRPIAMPGCNTSKRVPDARRTVACVASPTPLTCIVRPSRAASASKLLACSRQKSKCRMFTGSTGYWSAQRGTTSRMATRRSGAGNGSGRSSRPLTIENTAVDAPSVSASVLTTAKA